MEAPKSLTAVVHVRFHYEEPAPKPPSRGEIEVLDSMLRCASDLDPSLQELLVKFADHIKRSCERNGYGQNPS